MQEIITVADSVSRVQWIIYQATVGPMMTARGRNRRLRGEEALIDQWIAVPRDPIAPQKLLWTMNVSSAKDDSGDDAQRFTHRNSRLPPSSVAFIKMSNFGRPKIPFFDTKFSFKKSGTIPKDVFWNRICI
jgi:hypothetical protein